MLLSIVIPCYNEEQVIEETVKQLRSFCDELTNMQAELIFVDDGSSDKTLELLKDFSLKDARIKLIVFSRNFGHQIAVTAGIDAAKGDVVVLIDADLQDPPKVIHDMIKVWHQGYEVVYGTRTERTGESKFKILTAKSFYRFLNYISEISIPLDTGDFRLMSRNVVETLKAMPEKDRYIRGMVSWVGFRQIALPYKRSARFAGETKYPIRKMIRFATDGILSFSTKPLQISITLGLISAILAMLGIIYALVLRLFSNIWVEGWTALMIAILFMGGVQLIGLGIIGEYIGRIYAEIKGRPLYIVKEYIGFDKTDLFKSRSPIVNQN